MVDNGHGEFADRILKIPVQRSHMQRLAVLGRFLPYSSHRARSLDEFGEEVESLDISGVYLSCCSIRDSLDFLVVARVGVSPGDSDVEVEDLLEQRLHASGDLLGEEDW